MKKTGKVIKNTLTESELTRQYLDPLTEGSIRISVINKSHKSQTATIFGAFENAINNKNIEVSQVGGNYDSLMRYLTSNAIQVVGMKMVFTNPEQVEIPLRIYNTDIFGNVDERTIQPCSFRASNSKNRDVIDLVSLHIFISGNIKISINMLPDSNVQFVFFISKITDIHNFMMYGLPTRELKTSATSLDHWLPMEDVLRINKEVAEAFSRHDKKPSFFKRIFKSKKNKSNIAAIVPITAKKAES